MGDDEEGGSNAGVVGILGGTVAVTALVVGLVWALQGPASVDVLDAEAVVVHDKPAILVVGVVHQSPDDSADYDDDYWLLVDAATGAVLSREKYATTEDFSSTTSPRTVAAGGGHVLAWDGQTWLLRDLTTGATSAGDALAKRFPDVAWPWYAVDRDGPGKVWVEADDRKTFVLDLTTATTTPTTDPAPYDTTTCSSTSWTHGDATWRFDQVEPERHSDPSRWALVDAAGAEVGLRLPYGFFVCDGTTGTNVALGDGVLVGEWTPPDADGAQRIVLGRLGPDGKVGWTWDSGLPANVDVEAFTEPDGLVLRLGDVLVGLDPDGRQRWRTEI